MLNNLARWEQGLDTPQRLGMKELDLDSLLTTNPAPKPYVRDDGTHVPNMFVDEKGRMLYLPPEPAKPRAAAPAPVQKPESKAINQGSVHVPTIILGWFRDLPPAPGFYEATNANIEGFVRHFDGTKFSVGVARIVDGLSPSMLDHLRLGDRCQKVAAHFEWRPLTGEAKKLVDAYLHCNPAKPAPKAAPGAWHEPPELPPAPGFYEATNGDLSRHIRYFNGKLFHKARLDFARASPGTLGEVFRSPPCSSSVTPFKWRPLTGDLKALADAYCAEVHK